MSFKLKHAGSWGGDPQNPTWHDYEVGEKLNVNGAVFEVVKVYKGSVVVRAIDGYTKQTTLPTYYEKGKYPL